MLIILANSRGPQRAAGSLHFSKFFASRASPAGQIFLLTLRISEMAEMVGLVVRFLGRCQSTDAFNGAKDKS